MDLVAGTHGRGIYKINIRPIQQAFKKGNPQSHVLFKTPVARFPWINDTHRDPKYSTVEKVPITFYLMKDSEVTISVKNKKGKLIWSITFMARRGFNQFRWDLVREKVDSPQPYFVRYYKFATPGIYEIQITGNGVDLKDKLTIIERKSPDL